MDSEKIMLSDDGVCKQYMLVLSANQESAE
jgi:hypothetical protein